MAADHVIPALYAFCVAPLESPALFDTVCAAVSPARREKALRFRQAADQRLSLGAGLLLRHALREAGLSAQGDEPDSGPEGKPFLSGSGFCFNLSHSGDWALCAAAPFDVGCDVERVRPVDLSLSRRFHPDEAAALLALPTEEARLELFFRLWTLKESFMKVTGLGMALPLKAFRIIPGDAPAVLQSVDDRIYRFREYAEIPGCKCAVCAAGDWGETPLQIVTAEVLLK